MLRLKRCKRDVWFPLLNDFNTTIKSIEKKLYEILTPSRR